MTPLKLVCHVAHALGAEVCPHLVSVTPTKSNHLHHQRHLGKYAPRITADVPLHYDGFM